MMFHNNLSQSVGYQQSEKENVRIGGQIRTDIFICTLNLIKDNFIPIIIVDVQFYWGSNVDVECCGLAQFGLSLLLTCPKTQQKCLSGQRPEKIKCFCNKQQKCQKMGENGKKWGKNKTASKETETEDVKIMLNAHPNV